MQLFVFLYKPLYQTQIFHDARSYQFQYQKCRSNQAIHWSQALAPMNISKISSTDPEFCYAKKKIHREFNNIRNFRSVFKHTVFTFKKKKTHCLYIKQLPINIDGIAETLLCIHNVSYLAFVVDDILWFFIAFKMCLGCAMIVEIRKNFVYIWVEIS